VVSTSEIIWKSRPETSIIRAGHPPQMSDQ